MTWISSLVTLSIVDPSLVVTAVWIHSFITFVIWLIRIAPAYAFRKCDFHLTFHVEVGGAINTHALVEL